MLFYKVRDRHAVYYRIFPHTSLPKDCMYLRRVGVTLYTDNFLLGRTLLYLFEFLSVFKYLKRAGSAVIIFEFTSFATTPLLYLASYFFDLKQFYLNINANLNNNYQVTVMRYASNRLKFAIIEPHSSLLLRHPWLHSLQLIPSDTCIDTNIHDKHFFIFTGYRVEQISPDCGDCLEVSTSYLEKNNLQYRVIGENGSSLDDDEYQSIFKKPSAIIILYSSNFYQDRHTGIALESIVNNIPLIMRHSLLSEHYINRGFAVSSFTGPLDLESAIINSFQK